MGFAKFGITFLYLQLFLFLLKNYHFALLTISALSFASITMLSFAYAQSGGMPSIPQMEEVNGKYSNDDVGVRIEFPFGWSGIAMQIPEGTIATVAPGGMESGEPTQVMTLAMIERTNEQPKDPSEFTQKDSKCDTPTVVQTTVSGAAATASTMTCTDSDGKVSKVKIVAAQTETHWISAMFMAPVEEFDSSVSKFDGSVQTLNILNVMDVEEENLPQDDSGTDTTDESTTPEMKSETMPVMVGGENVEVGVQTSLEITDFKLDEASKKLSFTADSRDGGTTLVSVGEVLAGPYAVTIDGQLAKDYVMEDEQTMRLSLLSGSHDISISGTQVVPEFPIALIGLIVAMVGIVAIIGRTKILGNLKY